MINGRNILAVIPARGGSKGVPRKNIKDLNGKPLISYTIEEGKKSKFIDRLIVSTDSIEIANIAKKFDVEVPFIRPASLAEDHSKAIDNYIYTISRIENEFNYDVGILVILQPTSPLRICKQIDEAIQLFLDKNADSVISLCEVEHSPFWYKTLDSYNKINEFIKCDTPNANRQELPKVYRPNGAIYVFKKEIILNERTYYTNKSFGYIMDREYSIDIDTLYDFNITELLIKKKSENI